MVQYFFLPGLIFFLHGLIFFLHGFVQNRYKNVLFFEKLTNGRHGQAQGCLRAKEGSPGAEEGVQETAALDCALVGRRGRQTGESVASAWATKTVSRR
jgi:hypothetical protein